MEKHIELGYLLDSYGGLLTPRQQSLMDQYINEDCSLSEIAEREGITRQGVRDTLVRAEEQLYELETQVGTVKRTQKLLSTIEKLKRTITDSADGILAKADIIKELDYLKDICEGNDGV